MSVNHALAALQRRFSGIFGVAARDLATGREVRRNASEVFPAASTIKVAVMIEVFRQVEAGALALGAPVPYTLGHRVGGSGVLQYLTPGIAVSLRDAVTLMIAVSDNVATNMVLDAIGGAPAVNATIAGLGFPQLVLNRRITFDAEGELAVGTPAAFCDLLAALAREEVLTPAASRAMVEIMKRTGASEIIGRYLPYDDDRYEEDPAHHLGVANKTGSLRRARSDVGIVFPPGRRPYVIALMSKDCADDRWWPEHEAKVTLGRVSRAVYEAFVGREG